MEVIRHEDVRGQIKLIIDVNIIRHEYSCLKLLNKDENISICIFGWQILEMINQIRRDGITVLREIRKGLNKILGFSSRIYFLPPAETYIRQYFLNQIHFQNIFPLFENLTYLILKSSTIEEFLEKPQINNIEKFLQSAQTRYIEQIKKGIYSIGYNGEFNWERVGKFFTTGRKQKSEAHEKFMKFISLPNLIDLVIQKQFSGDLNNLRLNPDKYAYAKKVATPYAKALRGLYLSKLVAIGKQVERNDIPDIDMAYPLSRSGWAIVTNDASLLEALKCGGLDQSQLFKPNAINLCLMNRSLLLCPRPSN